NFMVKEALADGNSSSAEHAEDTNEDDLDNNETEGSEEMKHNVFETHGDTAPQRERKHLTHDQLKTIVDDAQRLGSFKESFLQHAPEYGIDDIDMLFPDAKAVTSTPEFI